MRFMFFVPSIAMTVPSCFLILFKISAFFCYAFGLDSLRSLNSLLSFSFNTNSTPSIIICPSACPSILSFIHSFIPPVNEMHSSSQRLKGSSVHGDVGGWIWVADRFVLWVVLPSNLFAFFHRPDPLEKEGAVAGGIRPTSVILTLYIIILCTFNEVGTSISHI